MPAPPFPAGHVAVPGCLGSGGGGSGSRRRVLPGRRARPGPGQSGEPGPDTASCPGGLLLHGVAGPVLWVSGAGPHWGVWLEGAHPAEMGASPGRDVGSSCPGGTIPCPEFGVLSCLDGASPAWGAVCLILPGWWGAWEGSAAGREGGPVLPGAASELLWDAEGRSASGSCILTKGVLLG